MKYRRFARSLILILQKSSILVGGQAVIEGVMMRVPGAHATAVRIPDQTIITERKPFISASKRFKWLGFPIIRGIVSLFESMKIGMETLQFSADHAMPEPEKKKNSFLEKVYNSLTLLVSFALAIGLFAVLPLWLTTKFFAIEKTAWLFNLVAGLFRIFFFLVYLLLISRMKDIKRLFEYHGAEHKTVFAFEHGRDMTLENIRPFSTFHPRCGTSFLFVTLINAIIMYSVIDSVIIAFYGPMSLAARLLVHLPLIPLVMGVGYEVLKWTSRHMNNPRIGWMTKPGLWLQRITTSSPDDDQIECALTALRTAFDSEWEKYTGKEYIAEAVD
ncbi:MAG: hypothetical protein XE04_0238 [Marinimicrobia bacterium 46_43]|nr:MAG: hypothetical protein XE04_0238 [Marinimicrobia bacterium 46_43]HBY17808.1 DUF1385 domain-containing protein [Candidatus Neomarinimicrobiota bacterium]